MPEDIKVFAGLKAIKSQGLFKFELEDEVYLLASITSPEYWPDFTINQRKEFIRVSVFYLI